MMFEYIRPETLQEAVSLMDKYGDQARIIAGGTDLVVQMRSGLTVKEPLISPKYIIDIERLGALAGIDYNVKNGMRIGAMTKIKALEKSSKVQEVYPAISQAASMLGSVAIRNVATVGGNLCNAAPSAEMAPSLIGYSAEAFITGPEGERIVPIEAFFAGPGSTVLKRGELLLEIHVPVPLPGTKGAYLKCGKRIGAPDLAIVGVGVVAVIDGSGGRRCRDIRIVLGAVATTPIRARKAEAIVKGQRVDDEIIERCAVKASEEAHPVTDVRATAEYRREMVRVFTRRAMEKTFVK